jgi:hypothetical protein
LSSPDENQVIRLFYCAECKVRNQLINGMLQLNYSITESRNKQDGLVQKIFRNLFLKEQESGFIFLRHDYKYVNFSNYSSINIEVRSDDNQTGGLEFQIKESDGDAWYYFANITSVNWTLIHMPFEDFINPPWAQKGDRKKTFVEVELIGITLTSFDKPINKTVYFKTFGNQLFNLD